MEMDHLPKRHDRGDVHASLFDELEDKKYRRGLRSINFHVRSSPFFTTNGRVAGHDTPTVFYKRAPYESYVDLNK